jgi:transcription elongation factor Elf1
MSGSGHQAYSYHSLQSLLSVSPIKFYTCPVCVHEVLPTSVTLSPHHYWGVVLCCGLCNSSWMLCKYCTRIWSHFIDAADSLFHHHRKHRSSLAQGTVCAVQSPNSNMVASLPVISISSPPVQPGCPTCNVSTPSGYTSSPPSMQYSSPNVQNVVLSPVCHLMGFANQSQHMSVSV